jgi:hypothetical protein
LIYYHYLIINANNANIKNMFPINFPAKLALHALPDKLNPELHVVHDDADVHDAHPFGQSTQDYKILLEAALVE